MIDLNTLFSNALTAAINSAVAPLNERIIALESVCATQHEAMVAMRDRIAALEQNDEFMTNRVSRLENNPAQGVDTQAAPATTTDITKQIITALSDTEHPLFQRLSQFMDAVAEQAMEEHTSTYDHDSYDEAASKVDDLPDFDGLVTRDDMRSEIEDVLNNAMLSISI